MPISALPTPPSRSDSPQDFSDRADALLGALPGFVTEANALQSDVNAKESSASSHATIATNKAAEAQASANTASTKASEAAASAVAAAAAASNAEIAFDSFDDKYLGSKASDPATDNDGNPLLTGALYWNTTVGAVRVWNGSAWLSMAADASIVDFQQSGTGAVVRTAQDKMREWVSVKDFGAIGNGAADDTAAIQAAIDYASSAGKALYVPAGAYRLVPSNAMVDEAGSNLAALLMRSGMHIYAEPGAKFKISDAVSSDLAPVRMSMFFSNQFLSNISIVNLEMDMNGQNNPISPNRGLLTYNKFTQAAIIFSGTPGGVAAGANDVHIERCKFLNTAGVSCIVMAQSNSVGVALGKRWTIKDCLFYNNGLDTDDHSSVFAWAQDVVVSGNTFENPAPFNAATHTGGLCAFEVHGSNTRFFGNRIKNYYQGLWISINLTEEAVRNTAIYGNTATVSNVFTDFYSANLSSGPSSESQIQHVAITGNVIEITADAVADSIKAFFKIAARRQPQMVRIEGNVCRSYETVKNCVLALMVVSPDQLSEASQIVLRGNTAAGIVSGLVCYFGGTGVALNIGTVEFSANDPGTLLPSPGGLLSACDINLYGASAGKVSALRVSGLSHPTAPIYTDGHGGGRATVVGRTLLNLPVMWSGITLGNGTITKKIALDTDAGHADVSVGLTVGSTTVAAGSIYPSITGLVADSTGSGSAIVNYPASHAVLGARIDSTGNFISIFHSGGLLSESVPAALASGSFVTVAARFPCRSASI